jgi:hypothetical protein
LAGRHAFDHGLEYKILYRAKGLEYKILYKPLVLTDLATLPRYGRRGGETKGFIKSRVKDSTLERPKPLALVFKREGKGEHRFMKLMK